ncbi:MAG: site-specific integrase [Bacteroidales bacterium]
MTRRKSIVILPSLRDCKGDMTKQWFVEYSIRNPKTDKMERKRHYINKDLTATKRVQEGESIIKDLTDKLHTGWTPFERDDVIFEDNLEYSNVARVYGKKKKGNNTIRKLCNEYLEVKKLEVNTKSYVCYQSKFRVICQYFDKIGSGDIDVCAISRDMIISFLKTIAHDRGLSVCSVSKYQQIIHSLFNFIHRQKRLILENPVYDIPKIGLVKDNAPLPFTHEDRQRLADAIRDKDPWLWLACQLMYYTALRPGQEIRLLKVGQINLRERTITVIATVAKNQQRETIDIPDQLFYELRDFYQIQQYSPTFYVFGSSGIPGSRPLGVNTMSNRFITIRDSLRIDKAFKFYSWKHTGASALTTVDVSPYELQRHLRHKRLSTTEHYIRKRLGQKSEKIKHHFPSIENDAE